MNTFSFKFLNDFDILSKSKIGFEFEFYSNHSFIKTMELLTLVDTSIEIFAFNSYHNDFELTDSKFKIEPDYSGGSDMVELITGPMDYIKAKLILIKVLKFIRENGHTDEYCGIHVNISFDDIDLVKLNPIKFIFNFDENIIFNLFPNRRNNIYAKSIRYIIPFEYWDNPEIALNNILRSLQLPKHLKYYGVNFSKLKNNYLEFRYLGGKNYEDRTDDILTLMDYFIIQTYKANEEINEEDKIKLLYYLEENMSWFENFTTYESYLQSSINITINVDCNKDYNYINTYWGMFKDKLFDLIKNCTEIKQLLLNYNTDTKRVELIDGIIENGTNLSFDFINCKISNSTLIKSDIINCEVNDGHIYNSNVYDSELTNIKIKQCIVKNGKVIDCLFDGKLLDTTMSGGVFRSGRLGSNGELDSTVKVVGSKDSFWKVNIEDKIKNGK